MCTIERDGFRNSGLADMMPSLFPVNDLADARAQFVVARSPPHRSHKIVIAL